MLVTYMGAPDSAGKAEPRSADLAKKEAPQTTTRAELGATEGSTALPGAQGDRALVEAARAGDRRALSQLLGRYSNQLLRAVLLPRLGNLASAEDVLNESLIKACQNLDRFTWQESGFYPWLRTICINTALDHLRKRKRLVLFDTGALEKRSDETQAPSVPAEVEEHELTQLRERLEAQLARLNPRYAHVIRTRLIEGRSREAMATELGVSVATFDVLFHRAMKALKAVVVNTEENETP